MVTVCMSVFEACVATVTHKVKEASGEHESVILTDSQGNKIGTRDVFDGVIMFAV